MVVGASRCVSVAVVVVAARALVAPSMSTMEVVAPEMEPMPEMIRSEVTGTWAHDTMSRRVIEEIVDKVVFGDNDCSGWPGLRTLREEVVAAAALRPITDDGPDLEAWRELLERHRGETWLSAPWLVAEFYLYRRIAEATAYFENRVDVFATAKRRGLESALSSFGAVLDRCGDVIGDPACTELFLSIALWGNRMDLSLWPAGENVASRKGAFEAVLDEGKSRLLADDAAAVLAHLNAPTTPPPGRLDLVVDNAGFELLTDLLLADHLVRAGAVNSVVFRVKHHPTFVSDVIRDDIASHVDTLRADDALRPLGDAWAAYLDDGVWTVADDYGYWAVPFAFWEMPRALRAHLASAHLIVLKGDANYRRALGDRPWPFDAPFAKVASYFPAPTLCLRTLKAELGCGMDPAKYQAAQRADATWLTNGKWGVLQFVQPSRAA